MTGGSTQRLVNLGAVVLAVLLLAGAGMTLLTRNAPPPQPTLSSEAGPSGSMTAGAFSPPRAAPDFALAGSDGSQVTLARYRGKIVLMEFGFTYCAAVCPTTLATLAQARRALGKDADSVQVIFVTVDPARDDAASMRTYLKAFDPTFIGATGTPVALAEVRRKYGVTAVKQGAGPDYAMAHTSSIFLIDRAGKLRAMMPFGRDGADFVHDVKLLLAH